MRRLTFRPFCESVHRTYKFWSRASCAARPRIALDQKLYVLCTRFTAGRKAPPVALGAKLLNSTQYFWRGQAYSRCYILVDAGAYAHISPIPSQWTVSQPLLTAVLTWKRSLFLIISKGKIFHRERSDTCT